MSAHCNLNYAYDYQLKTIEETAPGATNTLSTDNDLSMTQVRLLGILRYRQPGMMQLAEFLDLDKSRFNLVPLLAMDRISRNLKN